jgi:hypothetical protein
MGRSVSENVAVKSVAVKNEEKLVPPSSLGGGGVEDDGDEGLDVQDPDGLKVEVGDHGVVRATRGSSTRLERSRRRRRLRGGDALPRRGRGGSAPPRRPGEQARQPWYACAPRRGQPHARAPQRRQPRPWQSHLTLAVARAAARALSAPATVEGCDDTPRRKAVAKNGAVAGGMPSPLRGVSQKEGEVGVAGRRTTERRRDISGRSCQSARSHRGHARGRPQDVESSCHSRRSLSSDCSHRGRGQAMCGGQSIEVGGCSGLRALGGQQRRAGGRKAPCGILLLRGDDIRGLLAPGGQQRRAGGREGPVRGLLLRAQGSRADGGLIRGLALRLGVLQPA